MLIPLKLADKEANAPKVNKQIGNLV